MTMNALAHPSGRWAVANVLWAGCVAASIVTLLMLSTGCRFAPVKKTGQWEMDTDRGWYVFAVWRGTVRSLEVDDHEGRSLEVITVVDVVGVGASEPYPQPITGRLPAYFVLTNPNGEPLLRGEIAEGTRVRVDGFHRLYRRSLVIPGSVDGGKPSKSIERFAIIKPKVIDDDVSGKRLWRPSKPYKRL